MKNDTVEKTVKNNYDLVDNKAKTYYQANKAKVQNDCESIKEVFQKMKMYKKRNYANIRNKKCQKRIEKGENNI